MPTTPLPLVSAVTAGILIIMQMILTIAVVRARIGNRQSLGHGGHAELERLQPAAAQAPVTLSLTGAGG